MKIEGLGESNRTSWRLLYDDIETPAGARPSGSSKLTPEKLEVGQRVSQRWDADSHTDEQWIITDVLGDGKFKAVPKNHIVESGGFERWQKFMREEIPPTSDGSYSYRPPRNGEETFDISGKVDTNNPIYKFYEKDVQKYLNKFGGKRIVDDKGVSWVEVPIKKEMGRMAVEAYGAVAGIEPEYDEEGNIVGVKYDPVKGALGLGIGSIAKNLSDEGGMFGKKQVTGKTGYTPQTPQTPPPRGSRTALGKSGTFSDVPTIRPKSPVNLSPALENELSDLEIRRQVLDEHPAKNLTKYAQTRGDFKGQLPEVTGQGKSRFGRSGDDIIEREGMNFEDTEQARQAYEDYRIRETEYKKQLSDFKQRSKEFLTSEKDRVALNDYLDRKPVTAGVQQPYDPVKKITQALKEAKPLEREQAKLYSAERAKRVARVAAMGEKVSGEAGFHAQLGQLKGELPKVQYESIRPNIEQPDVDALFDKVEKMSIFSPFEKVTAKMGLDKIFRGSIPVQSELKLLAEVFPPEFIQTVLNKRSFGTKLLSGLTQAINLPRAMMATADLSAPFRQGIFLVSRPKQFLSAFKGMFKYAFNEQAYKGLMDSIQARPNYKLMRESRLALTDMDKFVGSREEAFMSNLAEKIPGFGRLARGSNRAYTGFLNKLRADVFDDLVTKSKALGLGKEVASDIAKFVNSASGRGDLGMFNRAATVLNSVFFSPRLMASRLNLLNPVYYAKLNPFVRKEALKSLFTFAGTALTVLGLAKLAGADVEEDPRNADFAKIKVGNTRYDVLGGFQQYIRFAAQMMTGKIISSTTGREITLGEGYKPLTRKDVAIRFLENKESPVLSLATALLTGKTSLGEPLNVPAEVANRFIPLVGQDMYDLYQEKGPEGLAMAVPGLFGFGSQTYGGQELVEGKNKIGQETAQIRPKQGIGEDISRKLFGEQTLGSSSSYNVEAYYDQLLKLPKEEAAKKFDEIAKVNPNLAKKITEVVKDRQLGITVQDQALKAKGVASGDRAMAIAEEFADLQTKEEKAALWEEYVTKKIITKEVAKQLSILLK